MIKANKKYDKGFIVSFQLRALILAERGASVSESFQNTDVVARIMQTGRISEFVENPVS